MLYSIVTILVMMMRLVATSDVIIPPDGMDEEQLEFISDVNFLRAEFADQFKIQNMQMLIWSKELQNEIKGPKSTSTLPHFEDRNWRLMNMHGYKKALNEIVKNWEKILTKDNVQNMEDPTQSDRYHEYLELFNPHQNAIGCARLSEQAEFKVPCLIGPKSELAPAPRYQSEQSKCTTPLKFDKVVGLCTPSDFYPDSNELMFISVLNERRRQMAYQSTVSNIHELTWNENLKMEAQLLIDNPILPSNRAYRIVEFENYSIGLIYCHLNCTNLIFQTVDNQVALFWEGFEQYHPYQTEIACVRNWKKGNIMCLLGPRADFGEKQFVTGGPGSNCTNGYENNYGLCSKSKVDAQATLPNPPAWPPKEVTPTLVQQPPPPTAPSTVITVEPVQQSPPTTQPPPNSDDGTCPTRFTTEKVTPEPPPTHPPELADYEEIDGDEYDEDFPTGSPPSQNGYWYNGNARCGGRGLGGWILLLSLFVFLVFV